MNRNDFFDDLPNEQKEAFKILFEDKRSWYHKNENGSINYNKLIIDENIFNQYEESLKNFIYLQKNNKTYELNQINFANFDCRNFFGNVIDKSISFIEATFCGETDFLWITFTDKTMFAGVTFYSFITFQGLVFTNKVYFLQSTFHDLVYFGRAIFLNDVAFNSIFKDKIDFTEASFHHLCSFVHSTFEKNLILTKTRIYNLNIEEIKYENASFLHLVGLDKNKKLKSLNKDHFTNKESARLIKAHFEKAGNITEAHKFFVIEQEKYIEELQYDKIDTTLNKWIKLIPLYWNKHISNFGTNWARAIFVLFIWSVFINLIYGSFNDKFIFIFSSNPSYWIIETKEYINTLAKMNNPINAFKNDNTFKEYEAFGLIVRIISVTIIYQIIISFRQFTRRS